MKPLIICLMSLLCLCSCKGYVKPVENIKLEEYESHNPDNRQRVREFLHHTGHCFLATVDGDQPQVRPFGTAEIIEGKLYIQTGHIKDVAHHLFHSNIPCAGALVHDILNKVGIRSHNYPKHTSFLRYLVCINGRFTHRKNIARKTGIKTIAGLTAYAILNNII